MLARVRVCGESLACVDRAARLESAASMRTPITIALLFLATACRGSAAPADAPVSPFRGDPTLGKSLAMNKCSVCHKVDGRGGVLGPTMDEAMQRANEHLTDYKTQLDKLRMSAPGLYAKNKVAMEAI